MATRCDVGGRWLREADLEVIDEDHVNLFAVFGPGAVVACAETSSRSRREQIVSNLSDADAVRHGFDVLGLAGRYPIPLVDPSSSGNASYEQSVVKSSRISGEERVAIRC